MIRQRLISFGSVTTGCDVNLIRIATILFIMFVSANAKASEEKLASLDSLTWQYRVILVFAREPLASKALSNLHDFAEAIDERDVVRTRR
jgi:hypothetical protein